MDDDEYALICSLDEYPRGDAATALSVSEEAFAVIKRQQRHRQLRASLRTHRQDKALKKYVARHRGGASMCALAEALDFSPCMLARLLLEAEFGWSKTAISNVFKEATAEDEGGGEVDARSNEDKKPTFRGLTETEYQRVLAEVRECIARDAYCSPLADRVRHNMGVEYEYRLVEMLRNRQLVFESEDTLREKGLSKTPDVRLLLPIGVTDPHTDELRVVNWIDSKAMFGDRHTHETENASQLQGYVNRYGPGMVIYWFGHVANLSSDRDVFITGRFPREISLPGGFEPPDAHYAIQEGDRAELVELKADTEFDAHWDPQTTVFL